LVAVVHRSQLSEISGVGAPAQDPASASKVVSLDTALGNVTLGLLAIVGAPPIWFVVSPKTVTEPAVLVAVTPASRNLPMCVEFATKVDWVALLIGAQSDGRV
jgi:hypothetical protein